MTFRPVVAPLRGPGQSPVLPFACCVGSLHSVGRCGRCSCWCRFRVRGAQRLVCRGCAGCGRMCRLLRPLPPPKPRKPQASLNGSPHEPEGVHTPIRGGGAGGGGEIRTGTHEGYNATPPCALLCGSRDPQPLCWFISGYQRLGSVQCPPLSDQRPLLATQCPIRLKEGTPTAAAGLLHRLVLGNCCSWKLPS